MTADGQIERLDIVLGVPHRQLGGHHLCGIGKRPGPMARSPVMGDVKSYAFHLQRQPPPRPGIDHVILNRAEVLGDVLFKLSRFADVGLSTPNRK